MKLLRKSEVLDMVGVSYPTIWRWIREGRNSALGSIGGRCVDGGPANTVVFSS
jgi:predicted DNA-binding transcriptional regulator AlpA